MSIYYVYMRWFRETDEESRSCSGHLLTCESRYVADEFFRACQDLKNNCGQPRFTKLERSNPQFWIYDTTDSDPCIAPAKVLRKSPLPPSVQGRIIWTDPRNSSAHKWSIPPVVPGRDWVNGNTYYVRNIRQPNLYWYNPGGGRRIMVSSGGPQTKFRVVGTDLGSHKRVLIRSDVVRLENPWDPAQHLRYGVNKVLTCSSDGENWAFRFGDLLGKFGIEWFVERGIPPGEVYVTWGNGDDQDEWELC